MMLSFIRTLQQTHFKGRSSLIHLAIFLALVLFLIVPNHSTAAEQTPLYFGVLNQRSVTLTAQYWNPILRYVSEQSGVPLELRMGKTAPETTAMTVRGDFAFIFTNHLFTPERDRLGYRVIARPNTPDIQCFIIVREDSPITQLSELDKRTVVFPSKDAFVGYWVPMDALLKFKIKVKAVFGGNQEGAISQLQMGSVDAAAVNAMVLINYAQRENFHYRVLWKSQAYHDMPIMVKPSVPKATVEAVRKALLNMKTNPKGLQYIEKSAKALKLPDSVGFVPADNHDYDNYREFYRNTIVQE